MRATSLHKSCPVALTRVGSMQRVWLVSIPSQPTFGSLAEKASSSSTSRAAVDPLTGVEEQASLDENLTVLSSRLQIH